MNLELLIKRINESMERNNTKVISCPTGELNRLEIETLEKYFDVQKEPFGYYKFTKHIK